MGHLKLYQIDAFTNDVFLGNPAAVCPLENWLGDQTLHAIARENNLAETAFFIRTKSGYHIRWFTPTHEVPLCGHATLASAFVIFTELDPDCTSVRFESESGPLHVVRDNDLFIMDFPAFKMKPCPQIPENVLRGLKVEPLELFSVDDDPNYYAIFETEEEVRAIEPDFKALELLHPYGVVVTAPGDSSDCVSRSFAPSYGIPEDPVTGSTHSALVPFWAKRFKKTHIHAFQASQRGGDLYCEDKGGRVLIAGSAVKYLEGTIFI